MSNDLETMRQRLRDELFDVDDATWNAGEKDDALYSAVRRLAFRVPRPIDPDASTAVSEITLVTSTYFYAVNANYVNVDRVFFIDSSSNEIGYLTAGWEIVGDLEAGTGKIHISPRIVEKGGTLRLSGTGQYTLPVVTDTAATKATGILNIHVPLVLAWARETLWRRLLSDRARFRQWQNANQVQNISVNELVQMIQDASRQSDEEWSLLKRFQKPVIGRI